MRAIANYLLHPLMIFWIIMILGIFFRIRKKQLSTFFLIFGLAWLLLLSTPPLPRWLVSSLELQHQALNNIDFLLADTAIHILVLGGGHTADARFPSNDQLSESALGRLVEGIRLNRLLPKSKLVVSGYSRLGIRESHAEVLAQTATSLGVDAAKIRLVPTPSNTREEALHYHAKFGTTNRLVLVTSAIHMPRAMFHFRAVGLDPIAAPTNHLIKKDKLSKSFSLRPSARNLTKMSAVLHEYVGMWYAKWKTG